jgi:hypothetical protein
MVLNMLIFQAFAQPEKSDSDTGNTEFGIRMRRLKYFVDAKLGVDSFLSSDRQSGALGDADRIFEKKDISDFASTLTPGAKNAIRAASFAWGYENAARYVDNAMKLEDVKRAADPLERSEIVIQSIQKQAEGEHEQNTAISNFVWSFYNEDLKTSQAQSVTSESISSHDKAEDKQKEQIQQQVAIPLSSAEAATSGILADSTHPALLYCAGAYAEATAQAEQLETVEKKAELAKLISPSPETMAAIRSKKFDLNEDAIKIAEGRRDEVVNEYTKVEADLKTAIAVLDSFDTDKKENLQKVANMLPHELSAHLLLHEKDFVKRRTLSMQLSKWLAFSRGSRKSLSSVSLSKLVGLAAISSLFGK